MAASKLRFCLRVSQHSRRAAARANCRLPPRRRAAVDEGDDGDGDEADIIAVVADYEGGAAVGTIAIVVVVFSRTCCQSR